MVFSMITFTSYDPWDPPILGPGWVYPAFTGFIQSLVHQALQGISWRHVSPEKWGYPLVICYIAIENDHL